MEPPVAAAVGPTPRFSDLLETPLAPAIPLNLGGIGQLVTIPNVRDGDAKIACIQGGDVDVGVQ
jgi:hypothetical protein